MKVAFIGLGVMGYPMAGHLKNVGMDVCVYNRSGEKPASGASNTGAKWQRHQPQRHSNARWY